MDASPVIFISAPNGAINKMLPYEVKKEIPELANINAVHISYFDRQKPLTVYDLYKIANCSYAYFYEGFYKDRQCVLEYFWAAYHLGRNKVIATIPQSSLLYFDIVGDKDLFTSDTPEPLLRDLNNLIQPVAAFFII